VDVKRLGNVLLTGGVLLLVAAVLWWFAFYSSVVREMRRLSGGQGEGSVLDALSCLYSSSGVCALVSGVAALAGKTPYEPMLFWIGLGVLVIGILLRVSARPAGATR
jgi:hypothetical protein